MLIKGSVSPSMYLFHWLPRRYKYLIPGRFRAGSIYETGVGVPSLNGAGNKVSAELEYTALAAEDKDQPHVCSLSNAADMATHTEISTNSVTLDMIGEYTFYFSLYILLSSLNRDWLLSLII